ncbi:MAG: tetratricopeptide repeat protein [Candidatus Thorarchaeota archaeon]
MTVPEVMYKAYTLLNEGKEEVAWQIIENWEKKEHLNPEEKHLYSMFKGSILFLTGRLEEILNMVEEHYRESISQNNTLYAIDALIWKSFALFMFLRIPELGECIKSCENMLNSELNEPISEIEWRKAAFWYIKGYYLFNTNRYDKALKELKKSFKIVEKYETLSIIKPMILSAFGFVYTGIGELDLALSSHKESLSLSKGNYMAIQIINATSYHDIGMIYFQRGDFDLAIEYYEKSLKLWSKFTSPMAIGWVSIEYNSLIKASLYKDSPKRAKEYFDNFQKYYENKKAPNYYYMHLSKAQILKSSTRTRDRADAERELKKMIAVFPFFPAVLIELSDLYIEEYQSTQDLEILDDIQPLIEGLLRISEYTHSYSLQAQIFLLHAKLSLLQINMGEARKYLTQAQGIAEEHGFKLLAREISAEHDKFLEQINEWENIKRKKTSIRERTELASLDITIDRMQGRRALDPPELVEEEPILLLIMSKDGVPYFNYSFVEGWDDQDLFSGFMSAFNSFSSEFFSKSIDRIKIDENIILLRPVESFMICYVIKGQSYPALMKLTRFSDAIKWKSEIWDALNKAVKTNEMLELHNPSSLGDIVNEIFNL